jgi:hypothetical protein
MVLPGKKESKSGQPTLKRYQGLKLDLIKSLRAYLDQNRIDGSKLDFCKTRGTKNALNLFLNNITTYNKYHDFRRETKYPLYYSTKNPTPLSS